ncbi:MAG: hypothetical protein ACK5Q5_13930 [Planctomycetaceae bacterium]
MTTLNTQRDFIEATQVQAGPQAPGAEALAEPFVLCLAEALSADVEQHRPTAVPIQA